MCFEVIQMSLVDNYKGDADMQRTYNIPFLLLYEISIKPNLFKNSRPYVDVYTYVTVKIGISAKSEFVRMKLE